MALSKNSEKLIHSFNNLKNYIDAILPGTKEGEYLKNYLILSSRPIFNYTEAIIILCQNDKSHAAYALIRSLFEAHINIIYRQIGNINHKLALAAKEQFEERAKIINGILEVIRLYPNQSSSDTTSLFSKENLESHLMTIEANRVSVIKGNSLNPKEKDLSIFHKAIEADKASIANIEPGHFRLMYELVYRYLSPYVHLDIEGLEAFVQNASDGNIELNDTKDAGLVINQSISICVALVKDLYDNKILSGPYPELINEIERDLKITEVTVKA